MKIKDLSFSRFGSLLLTIACFLAAGWILGIIHPLSGRTTVGDGGVQIPTIEGPYR